MQLLHIDSSVLGGNSASRVLSAEIVARQAALYPGPESKPSRFGGGRSATPLSGAYCRVHGGLVKTPRSVPIWPRAALT